MTTDASATGRNDRRGVQSQSTYAAALPPVLARFAASLVRNTQRSFSVSGRCAHVRRTEGVVVANRVLFRGGHVLTMDPQLGDVHGGDVLVEDDRIAAVGSGIEARD